MGDDSDILLALFTFVRSTLRGFVIIYVVLRSPGMNEY